MCIDPAKNYQVCNAVLDYPFILQTPTEDLPSFTSRDSHHSPLLHYILKESEGKPIESVLQFLHEFPCLEEVSTKVCANGLRAGKCNPKQAVATLCVASKSDRYVNIVKNLLQAETDVDGLQDGMTPLMYAAVNGSTEILRTLLTYKATVDLPNQQQETSLLLACRSKQWQVAKTLFDHNANALHTDVNGETPLQVAITNRVGQTWSSTWHHSNQYSTGSKKYLHCQMHVNSTMTHSSNCILC